MLWDIQNNYGLPYSVTCPSMGTDPGSLNPGTRRSLVPWLWDPRILMHNDVIKWKHFPRYWPFVRGIQRSPVSSLHKGQWSGAFMFSLICAWINGWVNNREAGDFRHHRAHYDVIVMNTWGRWHRFGKTYLICVIAQFLLILFWDHQCTASGNLCQREVMSNSWRCWTVIRSTAHHTLLRQPLLIVHSVTLTAERGLKP